MCKVLNYFARHTLNPTKPTTTGPLSKHKLDQYVTRAAVYLLHRDPDAVVEDNNEDIQKNPKVAADSCAACGMKSMDLKKCTSCKKVAYCNKICQRKDWKKHKHDCTFVPKN